MKSKVVVIIAMFAIIIGALLANVNKAFAIDAETTNWHIFVDDELGSLDTWESTAVDDSMFEQNFWFRIGDTGGEQSVGLDLTVVDAFNPADNEIAISYGDSLFDPITADINYELLEFSPTQSIIVEDATVTNTSGAAIDLHWFEYTDLDIAGTIDDAGAFPQAGGTSIVQTDIDGVTNTDVRVVDGEMPDRWEITEYSDLIDALGEDDDPTTLANALTSGSGVDDYTHAFQWDITLAPGESLSYTKEKEATVGGFTGNDPDNPLMPIPPPDEVPPFWEFDPVPVVPGIPWWFDPVVAIGFEYDVVGNTFDEIELPVLPFGDNLYDIDWGIGSATNVAGGSFFDIPDTGIDMLTVTAIETGDTGIGEFVDPADPLAFITGFTFESSGFAALTMTPITFDTDAQQPVPEPGTVVLLGIGMIGLGAAGWRKRSKKKVDDAIKQLT